MFYHIEQFGMRCLCHQDNKYSTEKGLKKICTRIVEKAKKAIEDGKMVAGAFDVIVCDKYGREVDSFVSGTDYIY
jgi:hypothetical protein